MNEMTLTFVLLSYPYFVLAALVVWALKRG